MEKQHCRNRLECFPERIGFSNARNPALERLYNAFLSSGDVIRWDDCPRPFFQAKKSSIGKIVLRQGFKWRGPELERLCYVILSSDIISWDDCLKLFFQMKKYSVRKIVLRQFFKCGKPKLENRHLIS